MGDVGGISTLNAVGDNRDATTGDNVQHTVPLVQVTLVSVGPVEVTPNELVGGNEGLGFFVHTATLQEGTDNFGGVSHDTDNYSEIFLHHDS